MHSDDIFKPSYLYLLLHMLTLTLNEVEETNAPNTHKIYFIRFVTNIHFSDTINIKDKPVANSFRSIKLN